MIVEVFFIATAALVLVSAFMALRTRELIHATVWLALMLLGVAGVFLTVGGEFLATIQVLVYVGAVITPRSRMNSIRACSRYVANTALLMCPIESRSRKRTRSRQTNEYPSTARMV